MRTYTPSQAVLARSAGAFHWTPEGRRLYDFTSGVLVANLGHNSEPWMKRFKTHMGWDAAVVSKETAPEGYFSALPMTAYNAVTGLEIEATRPVGGNLAESARRRSDGTHSMGRVRLRGDPKSAMGALARDRSRDIILATRYGFHGKKGLANAVTGSESDRDRDGGCASSVFPRRNAPT